MASLMLAAILMSLISTSSAYDFYVGGRAGWVENPGESYSNWASKMRFNVNDKLVFKYKKTGDSVLVVKKEDYDSCNVNNPIQKLEGGDSASFQFNRSGPFYFISGSQDRCSKGLKMVVTVMAVRGKKPSPTPPSVSPSPTPPLQPPTSLPSPSPTPLKPPTSSTSPSPAPSLQPPISSPSPSPSLSPSPSSVMAPTPSPSASPTTAPNPSPSSMMAPTPTPSASPTTAPTPSPSSMMAPTPSPSASPTTAPTPSPSSMMAPTPSPSASPTTAPTPSPSSMMAPTPSPAASPTTAPTLSPPSTVSPPVPGPISGKGGVVPAGNEAAPPANSSSTALTASIGTVALVLAHAFLG